MGDHYGRCAIVGSRRRDAASLDAEGREPAIGGKRVPRLREVLKHFTRLAFVRAACASLIVPRRQHRPGPFRFQSVFRGFSLRHSCDAFRHSSLRHSGVGRNPVSFAQSRLKTLGHGLRRGDDRGVSGTNFQNELARSRKAQETQRQGLTATQSAEPSTAARRVRVCTACGGPLRPLRSSGLTPPGRRVTGCGRPRTSDRRQAPCACVKC